MELELVDTDALLQELGRRHEGIFLVGRPKGEKTPQFRIFSTGGTVTDLLGMIEIGKRDLLDMDREERQ